MTKINIPDKVLPGFALISSLNEDDIKKLTSYLESMPIGIEMSEIVDDLTTALNLKSASEIVKTVISFTELLQEEGVNQKELSNNLVESYKELKEGISEVEIEALKSNLLEIFHSSNNLLLFSKTKELIIENDNNFHSSKIITDMRLVFNDDLENKKRHSLIIHRLHIEYRREQKINEIYLSLDMQDLKNLQKEIERAIRKEDVIKIDYSDSLKFV